jgi:hypothetical protein
MNASKSLINVEKNCVIAQGDYFEGNVVQPDVRLRITV